MKNSTKFVKIFAIITVVLIAAGFALFGVFGFNQDVNYKQSFELNVTLEESIGESADAMKTAADAYLAERGVTHSKYAFQQAGDGKTLIYKFETDVSSSIDLSVMADKIETAVKEKTSIDLEATVKFFDVTTNHYNQKLLVLAGVAIIIVVLFVYEIFTHKLAGAVSMLVGTVISVLLYMALVGGTRIFAGDFVGVGMLLTATLTGAYIAAITAHANDAVKNVGNDKRSYFDLANEGTAKVTPYALGVAGLALLAGIALSLLVSASAGIQLVITGVVSAFTAYAFGGFMWAVVKNTDGKRKGKTAEQETEVKEIETAEENA